MTAYHLVMTVNVPGRGLVGHSETVAVEPGQTRSGLYEGALSTVLANCRWRPSQFEMRGEPMVVFWSLERDELPVDAAAPAESAPEEEDDFAVSVQLSVLDRMHARVADAVRGMQGLESVNAISKHSALFEAAWARAGRAARTRWRAAHPGYFQTRQPEDMDTAVSLAITTAIARAGWAEHTSGEGR